MFEALDRFVEHPFAAAVTLGVGIALLLLGGHWLVSGTVTIARRLGVSTLVVGLTVVALGTSSPELFFNVIAARNGHPELSFGNIVGSNIANIGLILGLTALVAPLAVHGRIVSKELPWLIFVSAATIGLAVVPLGASHSGFGRFDGVLMLLGFAVFMVSWYRMGRRDAADPLVRELTVEAEAETRASIIGASALCLAGLSGLVAGGKLSETSAVAIARTLGLSEALIGLTIVAVATSLPELATCIVACRRGHHDLAVGNVVGSNLFNLLLVLGTTAIVHPVGVPASYGWQDLSMMLFIALLLLPMAVTHRNKITRTEGAVLLALYLGYMAWIVAREKPW